MKRNGKLALALHALGHMSAGPMGGDQGAALTSERLAGHVGANPVVVRRVLGLLRVGGLVRSEKGHAGGWRLARPAAEISVAEVWSALGERLAPVEAAGPDLPPGCAVEARLHDVLDAALVEAERALAARLATVTIADLSAAMAERAGDRTG